MRDPRRRLLECAYGGGGSAFSPVLQSLSAALHEHDDESRQRLHQEHGADDSERRHDIRREVSSPGGGDRLPDDRRAGEYERDAPNESRSVGAERVVDALTREEGR